MNRSNNSRVILYFCMVSLFTFHLSPSVAQQVDWKRFDKMMDNGEYKSVYEQAKAVYDQGGNGNDRLTAAYYMTQASVNYQEDAYDSAVVRYRALLPSLEPLGQALCYAFLGSYDTALFHDSLLAHTPVERIAWCCNHNKNGGTNMTPTALDVLVRMAQDNNGDRRKDVALQRRLCRIHEGDADDVRIWHDVRLLEFLDRVPNAKMPDDSIIHYIDKYRGTRSHYYTLLHSMLAKRLVERGDLAEAVRWCDSALAFAPASDGGADCYNLKGEIQRKEISLAGDGLYVIPGVASPQRVEHRNVDHLWFRVIAYDEDYDTGYDKIKTRLRKAAPLKAWDFAVGTDEGRAAYRSESSLFALPALKSGRYLMLVSPTADFKAEGFEVYEIHCTDMQLVALGFGQGMLLDRTTGRPIAGQEVRLLERQRDQTYKKIAAAVTDADGRYNLGYKQWNWRLYTVVERDGYTLRSQYNYYSANVDTSWRHNIEVRTDRPIYRLGDTIQAAILCYVTNGVDALVEQSAGRKVQLMDANYKEVASDSVVTDDFGMATVRFVIPDDCLPGNFTLKVTSNGRRWGVQNVTVEEYKQPKFMVELGVRDEKSKVAAPKFGEEYTVRGMASSYSSTPVSGARVQYTVSRSVGGFRWWGQYKGSEVESGELTTAADGSFEVVFTPQPDSNYELSSRVAFRYTVEVTVTDINGESHSAQTALYVGFRNAYLALDGDMILFQDLNGTPLPGDVAVKVERLRQPSEPLLDGPFDLKGALQTVAPAEWRRLLPHFAFDDKYNNPDTWKVANAQSMVAAGQSDLESEKWSEGVYRVTLTAAGADTLVTYRTITPKGCKRVYSQQLLWSDIDRTTAEVGDTLTVRFGSRHRDVEVYYMLRIGNEERTFRRMLVSNGIETIRIPVDSTMLGGFKVDLYTVRYGVMRHLSHEVSVPYTHKRLKMEIATFRDRLRPGEQEEWTIKVKGERSEVKEGALVMTMYDDALNSYGHTSYWGIDPWRTNSSGSIAMIQISGSEYTYLNSFNYKYSKNPSPTVWWLKRGMPYYYVGTARGENGIVTMQGNMRKMYKSAPVIEIGAAESGMRLSSDDIQRMPSGDVNSIVAAVGGVGYSDAMEDEVEEVVLQTAEEAPAAPEPEPQPQVRANLNTLAFFAAGLRTDSTGTVTYRFTVPELLTRWNVRGLAYTRDIKVGTMDRTLVTSKPLMVQPNMPRFLRHGDSIVLMAKVMNLTDNERMVRVMFSLRDAADDGVFLFNEQVVTVGAQGSVQVTFPVNDLPSNLYVAVYEVFAQTDDVFLHPDFPSLSDGERAQLPVVTNRQAVTISQAMYINGVGEKSYRMPEFLVASPTREPRLVAAELTSNPVWLAIKCMPYLKTAESPSTLYLANQYYVNTLGQKVLKDLNGLKDFSELKGAPGRLNINEDVKQTLLKATPWVRDAESEEEQMAAVANYFNPEVLNRTMEKAVKELQQRQNADGGWSWMPEGKSSVWVTQQVLKKIDGERFNVDAALEFIDREHQRDYDKYIKPNLLKKLLCGVTDIDYLYTRSFYGKANTEAYRYYYSNALKSYKDYENLYTQAQLALIFHRHGDHKAALDLLHRLKEKSLESDEMGMYWRDNRSGWFWYQRPIETQALIIQAFAEITPADSMSIGQMQQWLLKQKQTTHWGNDQATTKAIAALMVGRTTDASQASSASTASLTVFGEPMTTEVQGREGYQSQRWTGGALDTLIDHRSSLITLRKETKGIAWGAVYYQFADDMDKIPSSEMGITLKRSYENLSNPNATPKVGDKVKVRIDISCDRTMDYLELIDGRPSCFEPVSTRSGWHWSYGLGFYVAVNNTDTRCYVEHIDKGKYVFEYEVYVTNPGTFMAGAVTMQCMYAPEFRAVSPAQRITVE